MHIVWLILKIIGAILGGLIGLALLLLLLIIFVPVKYQIRLRIEGKVEADSYVSWLLHIVHITIQYHESKMNYCLRIFGVPVRKNKEENEKKIKRNKVSKQKNKSSEKNRKSKRKHNSVKPSLEQKKNDKVEKVESVQKEHSKTNKVKALEKEHSVKNTDKSIKTESKPASGKKESRVEVSNKRKIRKGFHLIKKVKAFIQAIREKLSQIPMMWFKIKKLVAKLIQKKNKVLTYLKDEGTKSSLGKLKKRTFEVFKYISPRKLTGYIRFGTGDPCNTGQILGIISVLQAYFKSKISIYPNFEEKVVEADLTARGRMRVIRFLRVGGSLYFDKEVKKFIADGKRLKEELNG